MNLYAGVMSGTSLDGLDVAVVRIEGEDERPDTVELIAFRSVTYASEFRERLRAAIRGASTREICLLGFELGRRIADGVNATLEEASVDRSAVRAVGSHGQTVWHEPPGEGAPGSTLQLGEPAVIAERTGLPVVSGFRARDMAAGGQGAPLTAYTDALLFGEAGTGRAIQNLGGMGNVTALPADHRRERPMAFDTGPGVALIDEAVFRMTEGAQTYDDGGRLAAAGRVAEAALQEWLSDPFFSTPPPRSTGRERFSSSRLAGWMRDWADLPAEDLVSTLTELTARSVAESYRWIEFPVDEVFLCGGGARNPELARRIGARFDPTPVRDLADLGWDADAREAVAFALLARQHVEGFAAGAPWATGADGPRRLGSWTPV